MSVNADHHREACEELELALGRHLDPGEMAKVALLARAGVTPADWREAAAAIEPPKLAFSALLWTALTLAAEDGR